MICPKCSKDNRRGARFCDNCGYELATVAPDAEEMFQGNLVSSGQDSITLNLEGFETFASSAQASRPRSIPREHVRSSQEGEGATERLQDAGSQIYQDHGQDAKTAQLEGATIAFVPIPERIPQEHPVGNGIPSAPAASQAKVFSANGANASDGKGKRPHNPKRGARIAAIVILIACLLAGAFAGITYLMEIWGGKSIPYVVGMDQRQAEIELEAKGLKPVFVQVASDEVEGTVLACDPQEGMRVQEGSEVLLDIASPRLVPDVLGLTLEEAEQTLNDKGFSNIEVTEEKSNEASDTVISVSPEAGTRSRADAAIKLVVAIPYKVPDVAGMSQEEAVSTLESEGYEVKISYAYDENVESGYAIGTDPSAGSSLNAGSDVTLTLAKHRSDELLKLARSYLSSLSKITINGKPYEVQEGSSEVSYSGEGKCSFTFMARPYETHSWFGQEPETRYGQYEKISGQIAFNESDSISSITPDIKK